MSINLSGETRRKAQDTIRTPGEGNDTRNAARLSWGFLAALRARSGNPSPGRSLFPAHRGMWPLRGSHHKKAPEGGLASGACLREIGSGVADLLRAAGRGVGKSPAVSCRLKLDRTAVPYKSNP